MFLSFSGLLSAVLLRLISNKCVGSYSFLLYCFYFFCIAVFLLINMSVTNYYYDIFVKDYLVSKSEIRSVVAPINITVDV